MLRIQHVSQTASDLNEQNFVPLKQVNVEAIIHSFAADVTITQVFRNDETKPIEAVYCFPIEEKASIYSFVARIDDREIVAHLKEKQEAQQEYHHALQQGHGAYLLEQDEKSQDNFIINIGALPPSKECTIIIAYVTELEFVQGSIIRFVVPTTIAPRYNPDKGGIVSPTGTTSKYVQSTPYTVDFRCRIDKMGSSQEGGFFSIGCFYYHIAQVKTHLDRDILLNIELSNKRSNTIAAVETGAVMAVFTPTEEECCPKYNSDETNEFIFIIDCSGSMHNESKIGLACQAMLLFLKSLPLNCYFNIIRFGSNYESLFNEITAVYNEANAQTAEQLINKMEADLGGTELLKPLQWIEQHPPNQDRARQVFLLTDGEISNVTEVLDLCRSMSSSTRIFSFGLGTSPSRSLVKGLARSTNGRFVFIPPNSKVDIYVGEQLQRALQPCITNIDIQWNLGVYVQTAPLQLPPVYANDRLIVYALTNDKTVPFDHNSSVELKSQSNNRLLGTAKVDHIPNVSQNETIARLAAKALILELQHAKTLSSVVQNQGTGSQQSRFQAMTTSQKESGESSSNEQTTKQRIIELSLKYNVLSPHTAFVAVEKRTNSSNTEMVLREVPIEISADDHLQLRASLSLACRYPVFNCYSPSQARSPSYSPFHAQSPAYSPCSPRYFAFSPNGSPSECRTRRSPSSRDSPQRRSRKRRSRSPSRIEGCDRLSRSRSYERSRSPAYIRCREGSFSRSESPESLQKEGIWPSNDEDTVRYLIKKQNYDGLWNLDTNVIMKLTGKSLSTFQSTNNNISIQIITSILVVILMETRFAAFTSLWYGVVQKARKQIKSQIFNNPENFDLLLEDIRKLL